MKLFLNRDQARGFFGGVKFELKARVELTGDEAELVKKYKAEDEVLFNKPVHSPLLGDEPLRFEPITAASLIAGQTFRAKSIAEILKLEESCREASEAFVTYLKLMKHFGGEEVIEYT